MADLFLYSASFKKDGKRKVVVLHASDEEDALFCLSEGWGEVEDAQVTLIDNEVGVMKPVYEED